MSKLKEEITAQYYTETATSSEDPEKFEQLVQENELIRKAKAIVEQRLKRQLETQKITSVVEAKAFITDILKLSNKEEFWVLFLSNNHQPIHAEKLSKGTINAAPVYPRTVMELCIALNAATVILVHNHPSGSGEISEADRRITIKIQDALNFVDIDVLDHIIVAGNEQISFANEGLL